MPRKHFASKKVPLLPELFLTLGIMVPTDVGFSNIRFPKGWKRSWSAHRATPTGPPWTTVIADAAHDLKQSMRERNFYMTTQKPEEAEPRRPDVKAADILDPNSQIGVKLRSLYAAAQDEAIPDCLPPCRACAHSRYP
jgi:hypothetical protein